MGRGSNGLGASLALLALGLVASCDTLAPEEGATQQAAEDSAAFEEAAREPAAGSRFGRPGEPGSLVVPEAAAASDVPHQQLQFTTALSSEQRALVDGVLRDKIRLARGPAQVTAAEFDLDGDGVPEQFVIIKSDGWCGSGDVCNLWIYRQTADSWRQISTGNDAAACVSVLQTSTGGYRDVRLHSDCAQPQCGFDMHYDGIHYMWDGRRLCDELPEPAPAN